MDVEFIGLDPQEVAVRTRGQPAARSTRVAGELENLAQAGDVHAQCRRRARRRLTVPELLDQFLRRHRTIRTHGEEHQQLARFRAAQRYGRTPLTDLRPTATTN